MVAAGVGVLLVAAAIIGRTAPWEQGGAARSRPSQDGHVGAPPLPGVPLRSPAGLRLLVANDPEPFVLDVDSGVIQPVIGLPADERPLGPRGVGGRGRGGGLASGLSGERLRHGLGRVPGTPR
jgi:hypothetical protein